MGKKGFFHPQAHTVPCGLGFNSYSGKGTANTQLDTMANPHFKELELSHSDFIHKDVLSLLSSAVMDFTVAMRMRM